MGLGEIGGGFRDFYYSLEDRYYDFLDWLDENGISLVKVTDPIDRYFPSFILFILLVFLLLTGILFLAWGGLGGLFSQPSTLGVIKVTDEAGNELKGINVRIHLEGKPSAIEITTNESGIAKFDLTKPSSKALVSIKNVAGFQEFEETITFVASKTKVITLLVAASAQFEASYTLRFKDKETKMLITNQTLSVSYQCNQSSSATPPTQMTQSGEVTVSKTVSCGTLHATITPSHSYRQANGPVLQTPQDFFLEKIAAPTTGELEAKVLDGNNHVVSGAKVTVGTANEPILQQAASNALGKAVFTLAPGSYKVSAFMQADGRYAEKTVAVESDQTTTVDLNIGNPSSNTKKIFLKIVDKATQQPLSQVYATLYKNNSFLTQKQSNLDGIVEQAVIPSQGDVFSAVLFDPSYLVKVLPGIELKLLADPTPLKVELEALSDNPPNYGKAIAIVSSETEEKVKDARVYLYRTDYQNPMLGPYYSNIDGEARFSNLPPTTGDQKYFVKAFKSEGVSEQKTLTAGQTIEFPVRLILGKGKFKLTIKDYNNQQPISGATIIAFTLQNGQKVVLDSNQTNANGEYITQDIRVQQTVYFEISKTGYLKQTTAGYEAVANTTITIPTIFLVPEGSVSGDVFVLFNRVLEADGKPAQKVKSGKHYWAVFLLGLPNSITYNHPAAHAEAGERDLNMVDQNPVAITDATAFPVGLDGIVFSSDSNKDEPFVDHTIVPNGSRAKQVNIRWSTLSKGTYEFQVAFDTNQGLPDGTKIYLYYQAKALAPVEEKFSSLEFKEFAINEPICEKDCDTFLWSAYYSKSGEGKFQEIVQNPRPKLLEDQNYDIQYEIFNWSQTTFNADLHFSPSELQDIQVLDNNGFQGQNIPHGFFNYGMQNPLKIRTLRSSNPSDLWAIMQTNPLIPKGDDSNRFKMRFNIVGSLDMNISYVFGFSPPYTLQITVTDPNDQKAIPNADVEIQKDCGPNTQQQLDDYTFNPTDPTYQRGPTDIHGIALFNDVVMHFGECLIMRASNVPGYHPTTIIHREPPIPRFNKAFECIKIDTNPSTIPIETLLEGVKRNDIKDIKIISDHCIPATVCLHTLDAQFGELVAPSDIWFTAIGFNPAKFSLATDENKTVTVHIGNDSPFGYIPIFSLVTDAPNCNLDYSAFVEMVITPRLDPTIQDGFGSVGEPA